MIAFAWGEDSNVGRVRQVNQDRALATTQLAAVADGMGGHLGGEVAAEIAIRTLEQQITSPSLDALVAGVVSANTRIHERSAQDENLHGMGTTVCAIAPIGDAPGGPQIALVNVGDSRVYRLEERGLVQLTEDHSLVAEMVRQGRLSPEEAIDHPQRNILTRALGTDTQVEVDSWFYPAAVGERYLLCSDGLFNEVTSSGMAEALSTTPDPNEAARKLVSMANANGGRDNITCVVADVVEDHAGSPPGGTAVRSGARRTLTDTRDVAVAERRDARRSRQSEPAPGPGPGMGTGPDEPRARRFTWGVVMFSLALLTVVGIAGLAVVKFSDTGFFVDTDPTGEQVVIYQGRRDGFLWFEPDVVDETDVRLADLTAADQNLIETSGELATLQEAQDLVERVEQNARKPPSRTERPSTTTVPTGVNETGRLVRDDDGPSDLDPN